MNLCFRIVGAIFPSQLVYKSKLDLMIKNLGLQNITFVGAVDDVRPELANTDIFCCTSNSESGPMSVWEAMALEKPVVTSDVGAVRDIIDDGVSGYIVPIGDIEKFVEKIIYLICNPKESEKMGRKARETSLEKLNTSVISEQHYQAYKTILEYN